MKIWLIYKVAMAFWIKIYGCQPYPRNSHLCTKSTQKPKLLLSRVVRNKPNQLLRVLAGEEQPKFGYRLQKPKKLYVPTNIFAIPAPRK